MKQFIRQLLREEIEAMPKKELVQKFIEFVVDNLSIDGEANVELTDKKDDIRTSAVYNNKTELARVYIKNRAVVDICRSIAHELVHHKQNQRGDLKDNPTAGDDGSPEENEENAKAGELIRIFGRQNPEIYET
jgi:hypothetical protein